MGRFVKGKSGNPGGRPKEAVHFAELAKDHSLEALSVLVNSLKSENEKYRILAAEILLDRAFGKPQGNDKPLVDQSVHHHITMIVPPERKEDFENRAQAVSV